MADQRVATSLTVEAPRDQLELLVALGGVVDAVALDEIPTVPATVAAAFPTLVVDGDREGALRAALVDLLEESVDGALDVAFSFDGDASLDVVGEEAPNVGLLAACIRICCPAALPMGFTFAATSDRPTAGAFSGGWMLVTAAGVMGSNATSTLERLLADIRSAPVLDPVQRVAHDVYAIGNDFGVDTDLMSDAEIQEASGQRILHDGLLPFIVAEASDAGGDFEEAARMMDSAAAQLGRVADALRAPS